MCDVTTGCKDVDEGMNQMSTKRNRTVFAISKILLWFLLQKGISFDLINAFYNINHCCNVSMKWLDD